MTDKLKKFSKNALRKVFRRGYDLKFTYMCSYIVDPTGKSLSTIKRNILELMPFCNYKKNHMKVHCSERIVEIPFALQNVPRDKQSKILEIGCSDSPLSMYLANLGYRVTGVDLTHYPFTHPNFNFFKNNFFGCDFPENSFNAVILVSTVEHVGLDTYGNKLIDSDGDIKLVQTVRKILKPGGVAILTTPYGRYDVCKNYRVYDRKRIDSLFCGFGSVSREYYKRENLLYYRAAGQNEVDDLESTKGGGIQGLICVVAKK
jgi:2-polyprenyl-3-methyl-5-hydroxy-6-metoxy-1,4-benzoquinol methylase